MGWDVCRYWTVGLSGVQVSGVDVSVQATQVVIDSGTSACLLGADDAAAIHKVRSRMHEKAIVANSDKFWIHHYI